MIFSIDTEKVSEKKSAPIYDKKYSENEHKSTSK